MEERTVKFISTEDVGMVVHHPERMRKIVFSEVGK